MVNDRNLSVYQLYFTTFISYDSSYVQHDEPILYNRGKVDVWNKLDRRHVKYLTTVRRIAPATKLGSRSLAGTGLQSLATWTKGDQQEGRRACGTIKDVRSGTASSLA